MEVVGPDDILYRRIPPYYYLLEEGRISSAAFNKGKKPDPECSVYLARRVSPEAVLGAGPPGFLLIQVPASAAMELGLTVEHDPQSDDPASTGYAHCLIKGLASKATCDRLAAAAEIVRLGRG